MKLEDYFEFLQPDDIRLKGTRIGIETILYAFMHQCRTPEEIHRSYPTLTLEQIYATIVYYLHNQEQINTYLADWLEWSDRVREEQRSNPPSFIEKLRHLQAKQNLMKNVNDSEISVR